MRWRSDEARLARLETERDVRATCGRCGGGGHIDDDELEVTTNRAIAADPHIRRLAEAVQGGPVDVPDDPTTCPRCGGAGVTAPDAPDPLDDAAAAVAADPNIAAHADEFMMAVDEWAARQRRQGASS